MEISRKKLAMIVGVALIVVMGISAYSSTITFVPCRITMTADPASSTLALAQFKECGAITPFTSYDWDGVVEDEHYQCPVYVKNTGTVGIYITYLPTNVWLSEDPPGSGSFQTHFIITAFVLEFGMPCELYKLDTPFQLPEKSVANPTAGFYLPPGKMIKVDIVLLVDRVVIGETYTWEFAFWGCFP